MSIVNVMAAVSIAVCWIAFVVVWGITANYNESRAPAERQRSWYGTRAGAAAGARPPPAHRPPGRNWLVGRRSIADSCSSANVTEQSSMRDCGCLLPQ
jgi:hypothetical protein